MTTPRTRRARPVLAAFFTFLTVAIGTACSNVGPQDALNPEGPVAIKEHHLFLPVFWIAAVVFVLVEGIIVVATIRFRESKRRESPVQIHGNMRMEIAWTIAPAVVLAGIAVPTVATIFQLAERPAGANVLQVRVIGHQWWWEYDYGTSPPIKTATELVIPTGKKVHLEITSADVIHSFWVPKLAGKQDAVPGRMNPLTLEATKTGTYAGQCAEFCALSHANMRLRVVAKSPAEFQTWLAGQQEDAFLPTSGLAAEGAKLFKKNPLASCIACHTVRGIPEAGGQVGPDLTHFASRLTFAGSIFDRNEQTVADWLRNPPGLKPGSLMPNYHLPEDMIRALVAFLESLR